jgi:hypothetical protein
MLERIERALLVGQRPSLDPAFDPHAGAFEEGDEGNDASMLRLTHLLEQERPDLRERVVGVLSLETDQLDDAMLFAIARDYLLPTPERRMGRLLRSRDRSTRRGGGCFAP